MEAQDSSRSFSRRRFEPKRCLMALGILVCLAMIVLVPVYLKLRIGRTQPSKDGIECPGFKDQSGCEKKGCIYSQAKGRPSCTMKKDAFGYSVERVYKEGDGPELQLKALASDTPYGPSFENVEFKLTYLTDNILRFQFRNSESKRYEVPIQDDFPLLKNLTPLGDTGNLSYEVVHANRTEVFYFQVRRKNESKALLWDTKIGALLLSDRFLQIASYLPSRNVYGFGENSHDTLRHDLNFKSWPLFAADNHPQVPTNMQNLYGVHPFYTCLENDGRSHGVFFLNSNAMEVTLMPAPAMSFRTVGGILDFFIFVGESPEHVVQLYTSLIGRPMMPPYWSLGFQLSRYDYQTLDNVSRIIQRTRAAKIPQAVQYLDIDHLDDAEDFTYNNDTFKGLPKFIERTKKEFGLKWIIIQEPTLPVSEKSKLYASALKRSAFVKRSRGWSPNMFPSGDFFRNANVTFGKVWSSYLVGFLDFFRNETKDWWKEELVKHRKTIQYDGIWIDMNEPTNFGTNEPSPEYCENGIANLDRCWVLKCPFSRSHETPPYNPLKKTGSDELSAKTLCMASRQGEPGAEYVHYDVHSLYGWSQTLPTVRAAQEATGTRSLVISRSTYPSSGRYAGHWLGDNKSSFQHMQKSIIGMLEFNMFGIPYVGADVCGFNDDSWAELCKRWMQLGAFYPYYRNHNTKGTKDQDPGKFGRDTTEFSRKAVERRIRLNPYLYTLLALAHMKGGTVVRPLFHEFPGDEMTWDLSTQFMWGRSLMIAPVLHEGQTTLSVYFPNDEWWHFKENSTVRRDFKGRTADERDYDEYTPLYVRGGTVLPYGGYNWDEYPEKSGPRNITLYVFPKNGQATGELFADDGVSIDTIENEAYDFYTFTYKNCTLTIESEDRSNFNDSAPPFLDQVLIFKISDAAKVTGGQYDIRLDKDCKCAIVTVNRKMKDVRDIAWKDSEGKCPDSK